MLRRFFRLNTMVIGLGLITLVFAVVAGHQASAQKVTEGYQSDQTLQPGQIVQLKPGDGRKVEALDQQHQAAMLGVIVSATDAPVSLSSSANANQVFVATYGQYDALVSSQNGAIKSGDYITISAINGVGMKADSDQTVILGKALESFKGTSDAQSSASISGSFGSKQTIGLGRIKVDISVAHNPLFAKQEQAGVPRILSRLANIVSDKPIGPFRIYISLIVLLITVVATGSMLYAGVRSAVTAVGRNPLAKPKITKSLVQVVIIALIIFLLGLTGVYLLLRV